MATMTAGALHWSDHDEVYHDAPTGHNLPEDEHSATGYDQQPSSFGPVTSWQQTDPTAPEATMTTQTSAWIHRDKLEEIESRELAAAGIDSTHLDHPYHNAAEAQASDDMASVESSPQQASPRRTSRLPSKIPVSKNSPLPLSHAVIDRDSPHPRGRNPSNALSSYSNDEHTPARPRSQSLGSQQDGQDYMRGSPTPGTRNSRLSGHFALCSSPPPFKPLTVVKRPAESSSMPRSTSQPKARPISISISSADMVSRPRPTSITRAPGPINRPEGEAPWIATMYKPDPMLPPDQQMLPTHAKRLREEEELRKQRLEAEQASRQQASALQRPLSTHPPHFVQRVDGTGSLWPAAYIEKPPETHKPPETTTLPTEPTKELDPGPSPKPSKRVLRKSSSQSLGKRLQKEKPSVQVERSLQAVPLNGVTTIITGNDGVDEKASASRPDHVGKKRFACCVVM